jgi:hypothetical protein
MSLIKSTFVMIVGVAAYAVNASFLKDVLDKINVCLLVGVAAAL